MRMIRLRTPLVLLCIFGSVTLVLLRAVSAADCNLNGIEDVEDIQVATSADCNGNQVPDECESTQLEFGFQADDLLLSREPDSIEGGDLNGDGLTDVVTGNVAPDRTSSVSVLLSLGGGAFAPEVAYEAAERLSNLIFADLDSDGALDVVSVNSTVVLLFMNRGDGSFDTPVAVEVEGSTRIVAALDLGGDSDLDLVTSNATRDTLQVLESNPEGTLRVVSTMETGGERPTELVAADFDGDDLTDLAVANVDSETIQVFVQTAAGSLRSGTTVAAGRRVNDVVTNDFDQDGLPDLAAVRHDGLSVWRGTGTGSFSDPLNLPVPGFVLEVLDIDGDSVTDLLTGATNRASVEVLLGLGDGTFAPPQRFTVDYAALAAADFDSDGRVDIAAAAAEPARVSILQNGAAGALSLNGEDFLVGARPHGIATADFNRDGILDVVTSNGDDSSYALLLGLGDGRLAPSTVVPIADTHANSVGASDFDGDGDVDMAITGPRGRVIVYLNEDPGVLVEQSKRSATAGHSRFLSVADMDNDGADDLVVPLINGILGIYFNDGSACFAEGRTVPLDAASFGLTTADLDGDGHRDIAVAVSGASQVALVFQRGLRSFTSPQTIPLTGGPRAVIAIDLNRDSRPDLATANPGAEEVVALINEGGGSFAPPVHFPIGRAPTAIDAFDVQGDGLDDILTISETTGSLSFLAGVGDGTLAPAQHLSVGNGPRIFTHADMDADGDQDILVANRKGSAISLFLNRQQNAASLIDFLTVICTDLDLHTVSVRLAGPVETRALNYLAHSTEGGDIPPLLFPNTKRFQSNQELLAEVFPARFADLTPEDYALRVERRETREFFAGTITQLDLDAATPHPGATLPSGVAYGFSVAVDRSDPDELLTVDEVRALHAQLAKDFRFTPFGYLPLDSAEKEAAANWPDPGFPIFLLEEEEPTPEPVPDAPVPTPTFELALPPDGLELCGSFLDADAGRSAQDEYELKSTLRLRGGIVTLTTETDRLEEVLFEEVRMGRSRELLEPVAPGSFQLRRFPMGSSQTIYRFTYQQDFRAADGSVLEISWVAPIDFRADGDKVLVGRVELRDADFITRPPLALIRATTQDARPIHFGSCTNAPLPLVSVEAVLGDGTTLLLQERFRVEDTVLDTAAASLVRAEIQTAEQSLVITDYFDLVYSAFRHNRAVIYWLVLDPPAMLPGVEAPVAVVELLAPEAVASFNRVPGANYLGSDLQPLKTLAVTSFERKLAPPTIAMFRRGDASNNGTLGITDALALLGYLFQGAEGLPCQRAGDANDDGRVNVTDVVRIVSLLFRQAEALPPPFPDCGLDPTGDALECAMACEG